MVNLSGTEMDVIVPTGTVPERGATHGGGGARGRAEWTRGAATGRAETRVPVPDAALPPAATTTSAATAAPPEATFSLSRTNPRSDPNTSAGSGPERVERGAPAEGGQKDPLPYRLLCPTPGALRAPGDTSPEPSRVAWAAGLGLASSVEGTWTGERARLGRWDLAPN